MDIYETRVNDKQSIVARHDLIVSESPKFLSNDQASEYRDNGFIVIKTFFGNAEIEASKECAGLIFSEHMDTNIVKEPSSDVIRSALGVHWQEPFMSMGESEKLVNIVSDIVCGSPYIHQSRINYKEGMKSIGWSWHSDFETWHAQDGMPRMQCVSAMIPLVRNTYANGALMIIPGSHKEYVSCAKPSQHSSPEENFADQKEGVPDGEAIKYFMDKSGGSVAVIECDPGDLVLFDCNVLHVSNPNVTPYQRTNLFFVYNNIDNSLKNPYCGISPRPEWMGARKTAKEIVK